METMIDYVLRHPARERRRSLPRLTRVLLALSVLLALALPLATPPAFAEPAAPLDLTAPAVPGELLVKFKAGTTGQARAAAVQAHGGRSLDRIAELNVDAVTFPALAARPSAQAVEALTRALRRNPNVEYVEPNYIYGLVFTPNDPHLARQYAWNTIKAYDAWDVTRGSTAVRIAVVDTGVWAGHPDLTGKVLTGYDYVDNDSNANDLQGHGTHVAGTAAARIHNRVGGAGTCPNCRILPVRVLGSDGRGTTANIAKGITFAANNGARVINLSLGGSGSSTLQSAVNYAWNKGAFLACAAGNNNSSNLVYPAGYANCFAVASTTSSDTRSSFSNYGSWVEVAAPGSGIYSTVPTGNCPLCHTSGYRTLNGTSMATPHVAGVAGLLVGQGLTNLQIRGTISSATEPIAGTGTFWTYGRINAVRAVMAYATPAPADYNGDGKTDISIKTPEGRWLIDYANNDFGRWNRIFVRYGGDYAHPVPADYDGDGKADLSAKTDGGEWFIDYAADGFGTWDQSLADRGGSALHPVPADYDGDGKADVALKTDFGEWLIDLAADGFGTWNHYFTAYGGTEAEPAPADYDGDGKADLSVKSVDTGKWHIDYAADGFGTWNQTHNAYGPAGYHPVPADYDGDGKADLSVKTDWGEWFIDYASDGFGTWNVGFSAYGGTEAQPVPADYDGDGKADLAVKTTTDGRWFIDYAADGFGTWNRLIY